MRIGISLTQLYDIYNQTQKILTKPTGNISEIVFRLDEKHELIIKVNENG